MNTKHLFTVTVWGPERPPMTYSARSAAEALDLVLDKAVFAALQVRVLDENALEINLYQLSAMAAAK